MATLTVTHDTWLKKGDYTLQAKELDDDYKVYVEAGTKYPIKAIKRVGNYYYFTLDGMTLGNKNFNSWYIWHEHCNRSKKKKTKPSSGGVKSLAYKFVALCEERGYQLNKTPNSTNIVGIEGMNSDGTLNDDRPDEFNDLAGILSFKDDGTPYFKCLFKATTEPGIFYTTSSSRNRNGAARIKLGFHDRIWQIGLHKSRYEAMCQTGNKVCVCRDLNQDYSRVGDKVWCGYYGINLHSTKKGYTPKTISNWSAGCTVIENWNHFQTFMSLIKKGPEYRANKKARYSYIVVMGTWL